MRSPDRLDPPRTELGRQLGFSEEDLPVLVQALTHPAFFEGSRHPKEGDNQRLEFLGDAVLDLIAGDYLYRAYPEAQEGDLSKMRAFIVCEASLAEAAVSLGVDKCLRLGHGSEAGGDRRRPSVLADAFEAVIGAVFICHGYQAARDLFLTQFKDKMDSLTPEDYEDKKSLLQEIVQTSRPLLQTRATVRPSCSRSMQIRAMGSKSSFVMTAPVGLFGNASIRIFVFSVTADSSSSRVSLNSFFS